MHSSICRRRRCACRRPPAPANNFSPITAVSPPSLCHEAEGSPAHVVCSPSSRCRRAAKHASSWWSRVYARSVRRGGRARAPARRRGGTSVSLSSPPARRRRAWWLSWWKPVARASSPQTGCGRGIYLRDLECHVDPAI